MSDFKAKIRERLAELSGADDDFNDLTDVVDQQLDTVSGGHVSFSRFIRFTRAPGEGGGDGPPADIPMIE